MRFVYAFLRPGCAFAPRAGPLDFHGPARKFKVASERVRSGPALRRGPGRRPGYRGTEPGLVRTVLGLRTSLKLSRKTYHRIIPAWT